MGFKRQIHRAFVVAGSASMLGAAFVAIPMAPTGAQQPGSTRVEFSDPGTANWSVPADVCFLTVRAIGGAGGGAIGDAQEPVVSAQGGRGGSVTASFPVSEGDTFDMDIGSGGLNGATDDRGYSAGGGGGATTVNLDDEVTRMVAGGGGGATVALPNLSGFLTPYLGGDGGANSDGSGGDGVSFGGTEGGGGGAAGVGGPGGVPAGYATASAGGDGIGGNGGAGVATATFAGGAGGGTGGDGGAGSVDGGGGGGGGWGGGGGGSLEGGGGAGGSTGPAGSQYSPGSAGGLPGSLSAEDGSVIFTYVVQPGCGSQPTPPPPGPDDGGGSSDADAAGRAGLVGVSPRFTG